MDSQIIYEQWFKSTLSKQEGYIFDEDGSIHAELENIACDTEDIEDRFFCELDFGTAGLRGVIGAGTNRMNVFTVAKVTRGIAVYLIKNNVQNKKLYVGISYDSRNMSKEFALSAARVLCKCGIHVYMFKQLQPTPVLSYAVRKLKLDAGIMITASHNPAKYNGYKLYASDGAQVMPEAAEKITEEIKNAGSFFNIPATSLEEAQKSGLLSDMPASILEEYYEDAMSIVADAEVIKNYADKIRIIYTPLNGCGRVPVTYTLGKLGFDVVLVAEQAEPDGNFPTLKSPNPENISAFDIAKEYGSLYNASLLLATDPDSDRVGIMALHDDEYVALTGNQTGALLLNYILMKRKEQNKIPPNAMFIKTIVTSELAKKIASSYGVGTADVLTGFKYIADKMSEFEREGKAFMFAFEESYGYLSAPFVRDKDAVTASILICEMTAYYASRQMTLIDALHEIYEKYGYSIEYTESFVFEGKEGMEKMASIMASFRNGVLDTLAGEKIAKFSDYLSQTSADLINGGTSSTNLPKSDVLSFEAEDGTKLIVRPSGTEPKIKLYYFNSAQSHDQAMVDIENMKRSTKPIIEA